MGLLSRKASTPKKGVFQADEAEKQDSDRDDLSECSYQSSNTGSILGSDYQSEREGDQDLRGLDCYHGFLPRSDAEELLTQPGDYLVLTILSLRAEPAQFMHLVFPKVDDKWMITDTLGVDNLGAYLVGQRGQQPIVAGDPRTIIRHPVPRQVWELTISQLVMGNKVGEGAFGEVYRGQLYLDKERQMAVAIKKLKNATVPAEQKDQFVAEARLCRRLHHDNIVKFRGVMVEQQPFLMVLEWADGGSLLDNLQKKGSTYDQAQKTLFCVQAAQGLRYLEKNKLIHRDVAARNCLISEGRVKISDFGLSLYTLQLKKIDLTKEVLPIRYLAPETFSKWEFSLKTDVFSFGVLMWEVFSLGKMPYADLTSAQVAKGVLSGMQLGAPRNTPPHRPTFLKLKLHLRKEYDQLAGRRGLFSFLKKKTY
ncbi:unnamed protein product, partial [Mesorhabditis spiculigera]